MPRGFWSVLLIAVVCGGVAVVVALPFTDDEEPAAVSELPGLVKGPLDLAPLEATPTPTPTPAPAPRRRSPASAPAQPPQQQDPSTIDQLPDGPFDSAKKAVEQSQQQQQP